MAQTRTPKAQLDATLVDTTSTQTLTNKSISGGQINSGTVAPARLGSGTPSSSNYLRGDGSWQAVSGGGGHGIVLLNTGYWWNSLLTSRSQTTASQSFTLTTRCGYIPFELAVDTTIDQLGFLASDVITSGVTARMGIVNDESGSPGTTVLAQTANQGVDGAAGDRILPLPAPVLFVAGRYHLAITASASLPLSALTSATAAQAPLSELHYGASSLSGVAPVWYVFRPTTGQVIPTTGTLTLTSGFLPQLGFRRA